MYNLIITASDGAWDKPDHVLSFGRFLEYTDEQTTAKFAKLDRASIEELTRLPTLFAYEHGIGEPARVGWLAKIQRRDSEIRLVPKFDSSIPALDETTLKRLSWDLGVGSFEWNRTHWAVKDEDLLRVLEEHGLLGGKAGAKERDTPPYATPSAHEPAGAPHPYIVASGRSAKVFLAHGRDNGAKQEVARYIERLGLEPIILHERPNAGRTLISKFREESADVVFAIVLMTPDDRGGLNGTATTRPRARQNVVFELGFFLGKLGPEKVCALVGGDMEKPSDFEAVVYIEYGERTSWRMELARELRAAGIPFDHSKAI